MKYAFLSFVFFCISNYAISQSYSSNSIYKDVVKIDTDTLLPSATKLYLLNQIKEKAEQKNLTTDTGYILMLIKLAKYEYKCNENIPLAIKYTEKAININKRSGSATANLILINALFNLGYYNEFLMFYSKALTCYDSVLTLCKNTDPDDYRLLSRYYKTQIYFSLGDFQKAADESTMGINEPVAKNDSSYLCLLLNFRAYAFFYQNNLSSSLADATQSFQIAQKMKDAYNLATYYEIRGLFYEKEQKFDSSEMFLKMAIAIRPVSKGNYETIAIDYNNLGQLYISHFQKFTQAEEAFTSAIKIGNKCSVSDRTQMIFMGYLSLAQSAVKEHDYNKAISNYYHALQTIHIQPANLLFTNVYTSQFELVGYKDLIFSFLYSKTEILLHLFKETGNHSYLNACLQTASISDTFITQTRNQNLGEGSKLYWRNETRLFFSNVIEACYLSGNINSAFYYLEKSRAVLLNDKWNEQSALTRLPAMEVAKQDLLEIKLIEFQQRLSTFLPSSLLYKSIENNIVQTRDSLEHFIKSLETKYPVYYQNKYADNVPSLQQLQQYLAKNNQSFVYYFVDDTATYALGIMKNKTRFIKVPKADFDSRQLAEFIRLCSNKQVALQNDKAFASLSKNIYEKLFAPLQIPKGNVAICTDNFFIPFEALCSDENGKNYLLYNYNFNYVYSARSLLKSFTYSPPSGNFIGFAPVSFSQSLDVVDLKHSASALENVADFYSSHTLFTKKEATRNSFITEASRYSVVTIFSHAKADTTGTEPVLYMQDSLIHLSDLQRLNNPSIQFVLLSACQTNIGRNATGEGIYSLARGFASAGIPSVSATLWKADEDAVYQISTKFNEYLSKGMNKAEALQKAKIWYLQTNSDNEKSLPFYWANMVLIGSSQPIVLTSSNHWWVWVSGIGGFLIIVAGFIFYKKKKKRVILGYEA